MNSFSIFVNGSSLAPLEQELAIESIALFFHSLTPRHQRKIRCYFSIPSGLKRRFAQLARKAGIDALLQYQSERALSGVAGHESVVWFYPGRQSSRLQLARSLDRGWPVLAFGLPAHKQWLTANCAMQVPPKEIFPVEIFANYLHMLYFDPGAFRLLQRGALERARTLAAESPAFRTAVPESSWRPHP